MERPKTINNIKIYVHKSIMQELHTIMLSHGLQLTKLQTLWLKSQRYMGKSWGLIQQYGQYSHDYEILKSFFSKFNIKPTWINCNFTFGWFDYEAGHWTGAVGQVEILYFNQE